MFNMNDGQQEMNQKLLSKRDGSGPKNIIQLFEDSFDCDSFIPLQIKWSRENMKIENMP